MGLGEIEGGERKYTKLRRLTLKLRRIQEREYGRAELKEIMVEEVGISRHFWSSFEF